MINEEDAIFPANLDMMYVCFYFKYDGTELLIRQVVKGIFPQTINANHLTGGGQKEFFFYVLQERIRDRKALKIFHSGY